MSINYTQTLLNPAKKKAINTDLNASINYHEKSNLSAFQRMLLEANGTVTAMLEAYFFEPIQIIKLSENLANIKLDFPKIKLNSQEKVLSRKVLLQGKISLRNFIYAESSILINNLDEQFSCQLLNTKKPIGKLWLEQKVETFKEIIDSGKHPASELSNYFCIKPDENLLYRTYSVSSQGKITMIITEKFPQSYFVSQTLPT